MQAHVALAPIQLHEFEYWPSILHAMQQGCGFVPPDTQSASQEFAPCVLTQQGAVHACTRAAQLMVKRSVISPSLSVFIVKYVAGFSVYSR